MRLSDKIQQGFAKQFQTVGVFFFSCDLEKAYATAWWQGIRQQWLYMGLRGSMTKFINEFLSDRHINIKVGTRYQVVLDENMESHKGVH